MRVKLTGDYVLVAPLIDLTIPHGHRCLLRDDGYISEMLEEIPIMYPIDVTIRLRKVIDEERETWLIDKHGWVFSEGNIDLLVKEKMLRRVALTPGE